MSGAARWGPASQKLWDHSTGWVLSTSAQSRSTGAQQAEQGSDSNRSWRQPSEPQVNSRLHAGSKVSWGNPGDNSGAGLGPCAPTLQLWQGPKPQCWVQWGSWAMGRGVREAGQGHWGLLVHLGSWQLSRVSGPYLSNLPTDTCVAYLSSNANSTSYPNIERRT